MQVAYIAGVWPVVAYILRRQAIQRVTFTVTKLARKDWNIKFKKYLRMHQITLFQDKKSKNFLGRGNRCSRLWRSLLGVFGASFKAEGRLVF